MWINEKEEVRMGIGLHITSYRQKIWKLVNYFINRTRIATVPVLCLQIKTNKK